MAAALLVVDARSQTIIAGVYDGATIAGDIAIAASTTATFRGGTSFTGAAANFGSSAGLYWEQVGTLDGKVLTFGSNGYIYINGTNSTLALASTSSASGSVSIYSSGHAGTAFTNQGTITHTSGSGSIYAPSFTNEGAITATGGTLFLGFPNTYTSVNTSTGTITADGANTTVYVRGGFANQGLLAATNSGTLLFDGSTSSANLGNVQLSAGGRARLNGTVTNTALTAPTGGSFELYGGRISGGSIAAGALTFTSSGGYLDGVTLNDGLTVAGSAYVRFTGGASFTGATANLGSSAGLYWEQVGTLAGKTLTFGSNAYVYINDTNSTLTLASTSSATGSVSIYSSGHAGTAFTNQGTITHTSGTGSIYAPTFTNAGSITASGGTLFLGSGSGGSTVANNAGATIRVTGGANVHLQLPAAGQLDNAGTIDVQSGTFFTGGRLTNAAGGIISGAGTINGNITFSGGTLAPGNSVGALTLTNSTLTVTGATVFGFEINGAMSDELVFQNPGSTINIGAGLVSLSVTLLSPPVEFTTYPFLRIASGGSGIVGHFAGLPNSGDILTAMYNGTPYTFSIGYQTNLVSAFALPIPEPSTYLLLGAGVAVIALLSHRRQRRRRLD